MSSASPYDATESSLEVERNSTLEWYFCKAVEYNYEKALQAVLTKVENPSAVVNREYTIKSVHFVPILFAWESGYVRIVEILLQNGGVESLQKHNKHKCNCLHTACKAGNFQLVKLLWEYALKYLSESERRTMINWKSQEAKTPLMCAVEAKQVDIVNYLLEIPGITLDSLTKKGQNIAHIAAWYSLDCLKALQSTSHMSSSLFLATDKGGWGVLHRACASENIDTLKWMMELRTTLEGGNDVLAPSNEGYSDALPLLFEDKLNEKTQKGCTPLLVACEYQHKDMVEYLLSLPEVDPSASTSMDGSEEGNTGLHIAAIHDSPDIANLLIRYGCPTKAINGEGDTALHIAQRKSSFEVFDILNSTDKGLQDIRNKNGQRADEIEPEEVIPPEIRKIGPEAVHAFRKALREGMQKISPQFKLLVLGEARVGKTSLVHQMTRSEFISNLDPTHGIENKSIATMVDSAHIGVSHTWKPISEKEQAERNQEHSISKAVQPVILKTETGKNVDNVKTELQVSEMQMLHQINRLLVKPIKTEPSKRTEANYAIRRHTNERQEREPNSKDNFQKDSEFPVTILSVLPQATPLNTKVSPPIKNQKANDINDHSTGHPLPKSVTKEKKTSSKGIDLTPEPVSTPDAAPHELETKPIVRKVPKNWLGRRRVQNAIKELLTTAQKSQESPLDFQVLDFAGQKEYRPMHHCFMSRRAIYIVVFNLQHLLDPEEKIKTFADIKYWLNSVHAHVHIQGYKYEKYIFLVGTHKNPGNGKVGITDDDLKKFSSELQEYLFTGECPFKNGIHFFRPSDHDLIMTGLENSMSHSNSGIEFIKKEIEGFAKDLPFCTETYPITWLNFKDKMLKAKSTGSPLIQLADAKKIAIDCGVEDQAVHTALQLFHDIGVINYPALLRSIYLEQSEKDLISTVILIKPEWLISIMTKAMEVSMSHPTLRNEDVDKLRKTGMTSMAFLRDLWQDYHENNDNIFQIICLLMRAHGLMQVIKHTNTTMSTDVQFMIPCMLCQEELNIPNGFTFYFDFKEFLPQEVFHCLICLMIKKCQERSPLKFSASGCTWYYLKGYDWYIQSLSQEHRLKVVARPRGKKKPDLTPLECISFLHEEYIRPICEQSGLPGLTYKAGPMVDDCTGAGPPHPAGVLAAVCYPCNGSKGSATLGNCPRCYEEYNIDKVLQSYPYFTLVDSKPDTDTLADQLCTEGIIAGNSRDNVKGCLTRPEKTRMEAIQQMEVSPGSFQTSTDALQLDKSNDTVVPLLTGGNGDASIEDKISDRRQSGGGDDFKNVLGDQIGEDDLVDVMEEVMDVASSWRSLGLALRLKATELDTISIKNHTDPTECLRDMLLAWLQQRYDVKRFGPPSWRMLCQAISKRVGGNNPALARKIADYHQPVGGVP